MRTHTKEKKFQCKFCQKKLSSKAVLKGHLNKHLDKTPYKCTECDKAYATAGGLQSHQKNHHSL